MGKYFNERVLNNTEAHKAFKNTKQFTLEADRRRYNEERNVEVKDIPLDEPQGVVDTDAGDKAEPTPVIPPRKRRRKRTRPANKSNLRKAGSNGRSGDKPDSGESGEGRGSSAEDNRDEEGTAETDGLEKAGSYLDAAWIQEVGSGLLPDKKEV